MGGNMKHYDCIFIGTGSANIILEEALKLGLSCAQIEKDKFGGTCLNRGCIPTKVLTTAADALLEINRMQKIGIQAELKGFDWELITSRVKYQINQNIELRKFYKQTKNLDVYEGIARFINDRIIEININNSDERVKITADKIYIGAGGRTNIPKIEGIENIDYLTPESIFLNKFPEKPYESLLIIGGGAIGCEFAHIFNAFGTKVTLVQHNVRLLPKVDHELSSALFLAYKNRDIQIFLNKRTPKVQKIGSKIILTIEDRTSNQRDVIQADNILIVPGIIPNTDLLNLKDTTIVTDEKGWIKTNEFLETSAKDIFAFGDINGEAQFRHKANYEADILAHNLSKPYKEWRFANYDNVPSVIFSNPEVSSVGLSENEAKNKGYDIVIAKNKYSQTAKGFALGYDDSDSSSEAFAKLIIDKNSNHILGFHAVGHYSSTLLQPFVNLLGAGDLVHQVINPSIESENSKIARNSIKSRYLNPKNAQTVRETMVAHPSLQEIGIWTYYHRDDV